MESRRNRREPDTDDYYGSLERLPLAPLKGKPPPYASRRQHDAKRGNYYHLKGKGGLSSSVGDLTSSTSRSKTSLSSGDGWDRENRGELGIPLHPKQRHSSSGDVSNGPTGTPASHTHHQRNGSVAHDYLQPTREPHGRKHNNNTEHHLSKPHGDRYDRKKQNVTQDKASQEHRRRNTDSATKGKSRERLGSSDGLTSDSDSEVTDGTKTGPNSNSLKNYRELAAIPDHTLVSWSRSKSMNDVTADEDGNNEGGRNHVLLSSMSVEEVDYRKVESCTTQEAPHVATSPTSPTLSSSYSSSALPPSLTPTYSHTQDNQKGNRGDDDGDDDDGGLFVATPVFLEGSPPSSPCHSPPSTLAQQDSLILSGKQDSIDGEGNSALSTLRREILHLTRLKEEIEQNLIRSQTVLKDEVTGLREERGSLEAAVEEREMHLRSKEAEIQDLKDTVTQLQTLVFTNDGEARLQRQASDLQELLREEKRHHLEETTQLRREVQSLNSRLREKDDQLEKYRSSPSLSSLGTGGLERGSAGGWKTSLPDVRNGKVIPSLGASVAERRKSFSGASDSSDDSHSSDVGSLGHKGSRARENALGRSYMAPVRSYTSMEFVRESNMSPTDAPRSQVQHVRSDMAAESSRKSGKAQSDAVKSQVAPVKSDLAVKQSRKSNITPRDAPKSYIPPARDATSGKAADCEVHHSDDEKGKTRVKTTLYVELDDYSKSRNKEKVLRGGNYARSQSCEEAPVTRAAPVTKSPIPKRSTTPSTVSASSYIARPSAPPPSPPQIMREASTHVTRPPDPPSSPRVNRSVAAPPAQGTGLGQVTKQAVTPPLASPQVTKPPAQDTYLAEVRRLTGSSPTPRSPKSTEPSVKTSWMYKPVNGTGGTASEGKGQRRDPEVVRRETRTPQSEARGSSEAGRGTGGTSYISATIQCLFTLPPLRLFFREEFWRLRVHSEVAYAVANAFRAVKSGTGELRAMQCLKEAVGRRDKVFRLHQDPPAADLFSCLLAWLHNDLAPQANPRAPLVSSVVSRLFHGMRESLIVCPQRSKVLSSALESFNFMTLSVPGEGAWSLQELLTRRFRPQEMAWECQPCGRRHPCTHETHLLRPPQVLVLYLRKPSGVVARVLFPDAGLTLKLHQHRHREAATLRSREYQLVGVVSRQEGEAGSQYSAFCRRQEGGCWGLWEEERVTGVSRREVLSQQGAHLLFYLQQEEAHHQAPTGRSRGETPDTRKGIRSTCV